ncbi:hypothetical protein HY498_02205 [Candidatus Woesearchaeota archaeon]|nr:hypothetical protein [Candidatus Woesearchaeota archaeon]
MAKFIKQKALFLIVIIFTSLFYVINLSEGVSAQQACCEKTKTGQTCLFTEETNCDLNVRPQNLKDTCDKASYCKLGCCVDSTSGNCFKNTPLATCQGFGKLFKDSVDCSVPECTKGCCVLGSQCFLGTESNCRKSFQALFQEEKFEFDFRDVVSEVECTNICRVQEKGCCQSVSEATCKFQTRDECTQNPLDIFNSGTFCSSIKDCKCTPQKTKKCFEDDVYFVDSCGNLENKAEDCDFNKGSVCNDKKGEAKCISVNCEKTFDSIHMENDGGPRKNGESWCSYDGKTGAGFDLVGSRHYRHICINGEEIVEPCRDFREEMCINAEVVLPSGSSYIEAQCKKNEFIDCITKCNSADPTLPNFAQKLLEDKKCCENPLRSCLWAGDDKNGKCLPSVPPGFRFWEQGPSQSRQVSSFTGGECSQASTACKVLYQKKALGDWECKQNCVCETPEWLEAMNSHCRSLGDCGAHYNILGRYTTEGFSESSPAFLPQHPFTDYSIEDKGLNAGKIPVDEEGMSGLSKFMEDESAIATAVTGLILIYASKYIMKYAVQKLGEAFLKSMIEEFGRKIATEAISEVILGKAGALLFGKILPIIGWILLAYSVIKLILAFLTKTKTETRIIECMPWVAPVGGSDCDKCVEQSKECSEYRCRALGQNCKIVNEGTTEVKCVDTNPNDVNSPIISPNQEVLTKGFSMNVFENGYQIIPKVNPFTSLRFGIKTNELAICKLDDKHTKNFDEMTANLGDTFFKKTHNTTMSLTPGNVFTFYIRCQDATGNKNTKEYLISFETESGPDLTPPIIESSSLADGAKLISTLEQVPLTLSVNEPADCKFDKQDKEFDLMLSQLSCPNQIIENATFRFTSECQTILNIEKQKPNNFFFRCRDFSNNTNQESFKLSLISTENLTITDSTPKGEVFATNLTLAVSTSGGSNNGISNCRFATQDSVFENMIEFLNTNSQLSTQPLTLILGIYTFHVKCQDDIKNEASTILNFEVKADTLSPFITSIFKDATKLSLTTNKIATCTSSTTEDMTNSTNIGINTKSFSADLNLIHFIECTDIFNNVMQKLKVITG